MLSETEQGKLEEGGGAADVSSDRLTGLDRRPGFGTFGLCLGFTIKVTDKVKRLAS